MTVIETEIHRRLPQTALAQAAIERFGSDALGWRFRCTRCGETQAAADIVPGHRLRVAQGCLACGLAVENAEGVDRRGLWLIRLPDGQRALCFPLADEFDQPIPPQPPQNAPQEPAATPGPGSAESLAALLSELCDATPAPADTPETAAADA